MPFETAPDDLVALRLPIGEAEQPISRIGLPANEGLTGPAFREGNWLVSLLSKDTKMYEPETNYTPLKDIADSKYLTDYGDEFVGARSSGEVASIKAGIDRREKDLEIMESGGWLGKVAGFGAGLISPENLLPLGTIYRGTRLGYSALKSAASVGAASAVTAGLSEDLLNLSHPERSLEQTIFTVGTATIIGGIFGAGASKFSTAFERKAAMAAFDTLVKKPVKGVPTAGDTSLSAATADTRELQPRDLGVVGKGYQKGLETLRKVPFVGKPVAAVLDAPAALIRNIGPTNRVAYGEFAEAKRAMFDLAESPGLVFEENLAGGSTVRGGGPAVETHARLAILGGRYRLQNEIDGHWKEYYWGNEKERFGQLKAKVAQLTGKQEKAQLSIEQFRTEVSKAMRRNDEHDIPQVAAVAKLIRKEIFDPWKKLAIDLKLLPEDIETEIALSYLMRVYDHEKIIAQRPQFEGRITDWLGSTQAVNAKLKASLEANVARRKAKEAELKKIEDNSEKLLERVALEDEIAALRTDAEKLLGQWKGKSSAEGLMAIGVREEAEAARAAKAEAGTSKSKGERLTSADAAIDRSIARAIGSDKDLTTQELKALAAEIVQRILSTPDGRLSYDAPTGGPTLGAPKEGPPPRGPLAHRSFMIPDEMIEDWLVNDVEQVANMYLNTMVPDTLITQRFGNVDMEESFKKLRDEFTAKREGVTEPAKLKAFHADYESAVTDLAAVRDRVRNVYGSDASNTMRNAGRIAQSMSNINVLADMGGSAISQLNDLVGPIARYGFQQVFADGYRPFLKGMMAKDSAFAEAAEQYRAMGIGLEMQLDTKPMAEVGEEFHPRTKAERTLKAATGYYMVANFSAPTTAKAKNIAAIVGGNEIIRASKAVMEGKATANQIRNLGESSITPDLAERIAQQFDVGGVVKDGVYLPNTADWTDDAARLAFEGAVSREANISVVTPGQEKPLWLSHPVARILGQFKFFTASASTRILLANLQRRDAAVLQGVFAQIAMGMIGYKIYSTVSGRETSDRPQDWVKEGISRSGIVGWLDEGNALLSKATGGTADMYKMIGADKPLSRYASRSTGSQLLGPSWGKLENAIQLVYAASRGEVTQADIHAGRRLMPMQNLFYIRLLLDQVEEKSGEMLGVPKRAVN